MTVIDSDNRHAKTTREGLERFKPLADSLDGWQFSSETEGVKLYTRDVPGNPLPMVRGDTVLKLADPDEVPPMAMATASILPGCRKVWDAQLDEAEIREIFTRYESLSWIKMKAPWPVSPRDICGASIRDCGDDLVYMLIMSVEDEKVPPVSGCVRANLICSGWKFQRVPEGIAVTYVVQIDLAGSIPTWLLRSVQTSIPLCAGKLSEYISNNGFPPHTRQLTAEFLGETFDHDSRAYTLSVNGSSGRLELLISGKMYPEGGSVNVKVDGQSSEPRIENEKCGNKLIIIEDISGPATIKVTP